MKIALLCHGTVLLPAIETLYLQNLLVGIGVPELSSPANDAIEQAATGLNLPFVRLSGRHLATDLVAWMEEREPDVVCIMGFPYRIPEAALQYPRYGFFNFHGGRLPQYPGPDPVFWQLRNMETEAAITVHQVEPSMDTGAIAHVESVPISLNDTYGMVMQRMGQLLPRALVAFVQQLVIHGERLPLVRQPKEGGASKCPRPDDADQAIRWNESPRRIHALVRSCNPVYNGALTLFRNVPVRILSVNLPQTAPHTARSPGTILSAVSREGITVSCGDQGALGIDVICTEGGIHSGGQFVELFNVRPGESFAPFSAATG